MPARLPDVVRPAGFDPNAPGPDLAGAWQHIIGTVSAFEPRFDPEGPLALVPPPRQPGSELPSAMPRLALPSDEEAW